MMGQMINQAQCIHNMSRLLLDQSKKNVPLPINAAAIESLIHLVEKHLHLLAPAIGALAHGVFAIAVVARLKD
jgi:hypothetical protein